MKTVAMWIEKNPLSEQQRTELAQILSLDPNSPMMDRVKTSINQASVFCVGRSGGINRTDLGDSLRSLRSALNRMNKTVGYMEEDGTAHFLDDHYAIANSGDVALLAISQASLGGPCGFQTIVKKMLAAVEDFQGDIDGKMGKGRTKDKQYSMAILCLADFFAEVFPNSKLSPNKRTVFNNFISWFLDYVSPTHNHDAEKHIKTAFELRSQQEPR